MGNGVSMEETPSMGNPHPHHQPRFYVSGDGDDFGYRDGDGKAFIDPVPSHCHPYPQLCSLKFSVLFFSRRILW